MQPSKLLSGNLELLLSRGFLTPNFMTSLLMYAVLPAKSSLLHPKTDPQGNTSRADGLDVQTLEGCADGTETTIFFAGNGADAIFLAPFQRPHLPQTRNFIFWNYPDVAGSSGSSYHTDEVVRAGYKLVKEQIDSGTPANQIYLHGHSIGGGFAAAIAEKLHEDGFAVNITIDRSFSSLSAVIPAALLQFARTEEENLIAQNLPLVTSVLASAAAGLIPGIVLSESINTFGLLLSSAVAYAGYYLASLINMIPYMGTVAQYTNLALSWLADITYWVINAVSTVIAASVMFVGLVAGALVGTLIGLCLQIFDVNMPVEPVFRAVLDLTVGNLDSLQSVNHLLSLEEHGKVKVINTKLDGVIVPEASLNTGLGLPPHADRELKTEHIKMPFQSIWHTRADHNQRILSDDDIDECLTFSLAPSTV